MQLLGVDINQKLISRIELNLRFVKDYELVCFCQILNVSEKDLLADFYQNGHK
jgi:tRNA G10  N-methylase Trm11